MDFALTKEQEMIRQVAADFAKDYCEPEAAELDETHEFPLETWKKMAEVGLVEVNHGVEYGGAGIDPIAEVLVIEELSKASLTHGAMYALMGHGFPTFIEKFGTQEQKETYIPPVIKDGMIGGFCLTEPDAGSDAQNVKTQSKKDGDYYIINGAKCFITAGDVADQLIIVARADEEAGEKGFNGFIVDTKTPGLSVGKVEVKMGIRGLTTAEIVLEDVKVHKDTMLGGEKGTGKMLYYALGTLDAARVGTGAQALGVAQAAYDMAVKYSGERIQFGKPINKNQGIQWYIAEMASKLEMARMLVYKAAWLEQEEMPFSKEAAMAKLYASKFAREIVNTSLQMHGGFGYMNDYPLERMYRDVKITEIYEGSSEIMKVVIANNILKKNKKKR